MELSSALLTIDVTPQVIEEAASRGCNVVISHHPLIFNGIKKITGGSAVEKILVRAIKEDIAIYSAHTNLDAAGFGVSRKIAEKLDESGIIPVLYQQS